MCLRLFFSHATRDCACATSPLGSSYEAIDTLRRRRAIPVLTIRRSFTIRRKARRFDFRRGKLFFLAAWRGRCLNRRALLRGRPIGLHPRYRLRLGLGRRGSLFFVQLSPQRRILRSEPANKLLILLKIILHRLHLVFLHPAIARDEIAIDVALATGERTAVRAQCESSAALYLARFDRIVCERRCKTVTRRDFATRGRRRGGKPEIGFSGPFNRKSLREGQGEALLAQE